MKMKWLGHASFLIESPGGLKVVTDPFGKDVPYPEIDETADVVTVSHEHHDHNAVHVLKGDFKVVRGLDEETKQARRTEESIEDVVFRTVPSYHDDQEGKLRGQNAIFVMNIGGLTLAHLGDLGAELSPDQAGEIGHVNALCVPVGGYYTIDAVSAGRVVDIIKPDIVIPMHYRTRFIQSWPISTIDAFLEGKKNVVRLNSAETKIDAGNIPKSREIWVFDI